MKKFLPLLLVTTSLILACQVLIGEPGVDEDILELTDQPGLATVPPTLPPITPTTTKLDSSTDSSSLTKWDVWINGPNLRGANIYQRRVYPELDDTSMGPDPIGPPYTQEDFNGLADMGANYVNISHPGLFGENPPYSLEEAMQANLDNLLDMIAEADMFTVISFRTGPGRSEFTFFWGEDGDWFDDSYYNNQIWEDTQAQDAWVAMWRYASERYRHNPVVVGYDLMVEPNCNEVYFDEWEWEVFYDRYGGTTFDWNQLASRISAAVREVDSETPILIGGEAYSRVSWLPYLKPTGVPLTVYTVHQYEPVQYTHQDYLSRAVFTYPGRFDIDYDGEDDQFDRQWLESLLGIVDHFKVEYGVPVAVSEFGAMRWVPGVVEFIHDEMDLFEAQGMNSAIWCWSDSWPEQAENDAFNFRHGLDPSNHQEALSNPLIEVIRYYWSRNLYRPSNFQFSKK